MPTSLQIAILRAMKQISTRAGVSPGLFGIQTELAGGLWRAVSHKELVDAMKQLEIDGLIVPAGRFDMTEAGYEALLNDNKKQQLS